MSTGLNDTEIISKVLNGDHAAYAVLVERYQNYVFTLTLRIVKTREDAEEVAQDVFIKAYKYLADFRGASKFTTWLYTIVNNTCISFLRKKKLEIHSLDNERVFELADNQDSGMNANQVEQKSRISMVTQAISMWADAGVNCFLRVSNLDGSRRCWIELYRKSQYTGRDKVLKEKMESISQKEIKYSHYKTTCDERKKT